MEQPDLLRTALALNIVVEYYHVCRFRDVILESNITYVTVLNTVNLI